MENNNKILYGLMCIYLAILPLIPYKTKFKVISDILLISIILLYLFKVITCSEVRNRFKIGIKSFIKDYLGIFMILLAVVMIFSTLYATDKKISISESIRFLTYIILYFIIKYELNCERYTKGLINLYIYVCGILSIGGILQYITGFGLDKKFTGYAYASEKIAVTMDNPNNLGAFMVLAIFPMIMLSVYEKELKKRILYIIISVMVFLNIIFTFSRNALIGVFIGLCVLILIYSWKFILSIIIFSIGALFIPQISTRIKDIGNIEQNRSRIYLWKIASKMIKDHPILGVGNGNYSSLYDSYVKKYPDYAYYGYTKYPVHNTYLKVLSELGILGFIPFVMVLACSIKKIFSVIKYNTNKFYKFFYTGFISSVCAFLAMNMSDNLFLVPKTVTYFWVLLAIADVVGNRNFGGKYDRQYNSN